MVRLNDEDVEILRRVVAQMRMHLSPAMAVAPEDARLRKAWVDLLHAEMLVGRGEE